MEQVAEQLLCSPSKVARMETGHRGATARDIRDLCDLYGVIDPGERALLAKLAADGKQQGWWQSYELDYFATYIGLEEASTTIKQYQSTTVPGLLQTPDYVRSMCDALIPGVSSERADELVEVKRLRQRRLADEASLSLTVVLDEAVLRRAVGGPVTMESQLKHLIKVMEIHDVTIQVIPFSTGAHPAMDSTFTILEFVEPVPRVVYVEGLVGWIYIERPQDIARYEQVFDHLCGTALSPRESLKLIEKPSTNYRKS